VAGRPMLIKRGKEMKKKIVPTMYAFFIVILLLSLLVGCKNTKMPESESTRQIMESTLESTSIVISDEQWSMISEWKKADQERNKIDEFDNVYDDLMVLVGIINENRSVIENSEYPFMLVEHNPLRLDPDIIDSSNEQLLKSLENVCDNFKAKLGLEIITVHPGRISFSDHYLYSLVYTEDDSTPKFMIWPDESYGINVEKIRPNWYHVFRDSN